MCASESDGGESNGRRGINEAILRAVPDSVFLLRRDGTFIDYHAQPGELLFTPPPDFLGKNIADVLPSEAAAVLASAIADAFTTRDPVIVEYELPLDEHRSFEARLVCVDENRVLSTVRDITETKRTVQRTRDLARRLIASQEMERTRIARDLHDGLSQDIAAVGLDLSVLRRTLGQVQDEAVQETLQSLQQRTASLADQVRMLSHGLHSSVLRHVGLVAALESHCKEVERLHKLPVAFLVSGAVEPTSQAVALSVFRIAQEALHNTIRHAQARGVVVSIARGEEDLTLTVTDDGVGFDPAQKQNGGIGLLSIEERARLLDGTASVNSERGHGVTVSVRIPV